MTEKRSIEDRLTDLGQKLPEAPRFVESVMARVHAPQRACLPFFDRLQLWLNHNAAAVTVMLVAVMAVGIAFIFDRGGTRSAGAPVSRVWFYDTATGLLFTDDAGLIPPIMGPSGAPAVRAHLFSCGPCDEANRFVGYYERSNEDLRHKLHDNPDAAMLYNLWVAGREYSTDAITWVPAHSPQATQITGGLQSKCPPKQLRYCPPK